ncbi:uncharacterized protein LOC142325509 isoform X1 [Lycorma delicatula]|uniref:uncharacterized protein LOC142325509 isoform X1 n=1 Tax=Lycorma delicatula TaxID=130591 RepID=UPI003F51945C
MHLRIIIMIAATFLIAGKMAFDAGAKTPEEFVTDVLSDRYLRNPIMVLLEGCNQFVYKVEYIWSKVNKLPNGVTLLFAPYNETGIGISTKTLDTSQIQEVMEFIKATTYKKRCSPNFSVFRAIQEASNKIPYDSAIILFTSHPPNDPDIYLPTLQILIQKRCQMQIIWMDKAEIPGKYLEITQNTGGKVFELDDHNTYWEFYNVTNQQEENIVFGLTTSSTLREDGKLPQQVMIAVKKRVQDILSLPIQVDSTMTEVHITIAGSIHKASLRLPSGLLKELKVDNTTTIPVGTQVGVWQLEAVGHNYNITVQATSRLAYSAIVGRRNVTIPTGENVDLVRLQGEGKLDEVVLVDETGKQLTRLEHVRNLYETNDDDADETNDECNSEWRLPADKLKDEQYYVQVFGEDNNGGKFTRLSALKVVSHNILAPVTVELNELSQIVAQPGETINLYFDVMNNYFHPLDMMFYTQDNLNFIRDINPKRQIVFPKTKIQVNVILDIHTGSQRTIDMVRMTAEGYLGPITTKTYLYIGYQYIESSSPDISYTTDGYCRDTLSPSVCYSNWWSVDATVQDDSGLIRVLTIPNGLQYKSEFIAGTKDKVYIHYSSTCCDTKVDITAIDVNGNTRIKTIDIERVWLTAGEITAIVLGAVLGILILLLLIILIVVCLRRRRNRNFLMHH